MKITKAAYVASLEKLKPFPDRGKPEIALAGRSNVGKSSLINALCNNKNLARTSQQPGKTRLINLYGVNDEFFFADLPGYGFAKASDTEINRWKGMIEGYISESQNLVYALLLVDIRHEPTQGDREMVEYLRHYGIPFSVVCTKADKLSGAQRGRNLPVIGRALKAQPWEMVCFSALSGMGREDVLDQLSKALDKEA
ncbi:MAG: ribosome biogenesis GTP-binding protein YihA/YsxC [Clostridiales bacterium]|nr:ribosome biogenesis GTP-binding protein YihA/YsxC [Clostridiales bacterium]